MGRPLDFTFESDEGEQFCLRLSCCEKAPIFPEELLLSFGDLAGLELTAPVRDKTVQLLAQWLAIPTSEALIQLVLSNARRGVPLLQQTPLNAMDKSSSPFESSAGPKGTPPVAPPALRIRWSVTGSTPRPGSLEAKRHRTRRKSEPTPCSGSWLSNFPETLRSEMRAIDLETATLGSLPSMRSDMAEEVQNSAKSIAHVPSLHRMCAHCRIAPSRFICS